jgi:hypothetical protein
MSSDLSLNLLIIAGILVIINNILHFLFNRDELSGGRLLVLSMAILLTLGAVFGEYALQFSGAGIDKKDIAALNVHNRQLMQVNDSLTSVVSVIGRQYDQMNKSIRPFMDIAVQKYPKLEPDEALQKLAGDIGKMEKTINDLRPHLVYLGDSTRMTESGGETFYFTTFYFRAKGAVVRNIKIGFTFSDHLATVNGWIYTGTERFEKGRISLNYDSKGFIYKLDVLPLEADLQLIVKSRKWLTVESREWSPQ